LSGRLFYEKPTPFEIKNSKAFADSKAFLERNGFLPDNPGWDFLLKRYELNPERFSINHPNFSVLIERSSNHETNPRPPVWPIDRPGWPPQTGPIVPPVDPPDTGCTECDPCLNPQVVPEPSALFGMTVAIGIWVLVYLWQRKVAGGSVAEG